jgi:hypothetical protein
VIRGRSFFNPRVSLKNRASSALSQDLEILFSGKYAANWVTKTQWLTFSGPMLIEFSIEWNEPKIIHAGDPAAHCPEDGGDETRI